MKTLFAALLCLLTLTARAQTTPTQRTPATALYKQIMQVDSSVFAAFNRCDSVAYKPFFAPDLEFYHDLGGLARGRQVEMQSLREMCARGTPMRRELVKGSADVHPLKNYGAVEMGVHRFYHTNKGGTEKPSGTYKFIHVWQRTPTGWRITRIISYGHEKMSNESALALPPLSMAGTWNQRYLWRGAYP
jgi:ketosteroid isomerase-like protein